MQLNRASTLESKKMDDQAVLDAIELKSTCALLEASNRELLAENLKLQELYHNEKTFRLSLESEHSGTFPFTTLTQYCLIL